MFKTWNCDCIDCRGYGWVADVYDRTPKMSVYLVAFAVGEFEKLKADSVNGYEVRNTSSYRTRVSILAYLHDRVISTRSPVHSISTEGAS